MQPSDDDLISNTANDKYQIMKLEKNRTCIAR
jgi:hypothetical protein